MRYFVPLISPLKHAVMYIPRLSGGEIYVLPWKTQWNEAWRLKRDMAPYPDFKHGTTFKNSVKLIFGYLA